MEVFDERSEAEYLNVINRIYFDKKDEFDRAGEHYSNLFEELDGIIKGFISSPFIVIKRIFVLLLNGNGCR